MAGWLSRMLSPSAARAAEGEYRPGPYPLKGGWLSAQAGQYWNWWQMGYSLQPYGESGAMVEACVSAYSQTVAMCPGDHWLKMPNGGRQRVSTSALSRILKHPNDYQSSSDLMLNLTRRLYTIGEAFAVGIRNNRGEISELHLMRDGQARIADDGSIFYDLGGNEVLEQRFDFSLPIPARDVLHVRLHTPRHPLKGESPILATVLDRAMGGAALNQQVAFYLNQARPSFILETDEKTSVDTLEELRAKWDAQTQGDNAGKTPILTWGLKAKQMQTNAVDGQLVEMLKITDQNVALAFRMPLQVLGIGGTTFASTELLMQSWIASGLGFALNHIEEAFGLLFGLKGMPDEYLEFDTGALLRSAFKERIEGMARGVIGGIFSSDEARDEFDLPATPGGHGKMPRVQQQVVPLSYGTEMEPPKPQAAIAAPAAPQDDPAGRQMDFVREHLREEHLDLREALFAAKQRYDGLMVSLQAGLAAVRDGEPGPPGIQGEPGPEGRCGLSFRVRGTWLEINEYQALDVVALGGASFAARHDDPGPCPGDGWQLLSAQGKRGNAGARGPAGAKGDRGEAGPPVVALAVSDEGMLTLTNGDGTIVRCDLYPMLARVAR